jgi:catechol 2,3-dioxygenase
MMERVSLHVANLKAQVDFYQRALGLHLNWQEANQAGLGADDTDLLRLVEFPQYKRYSRVTGLYHFALRYPDRHTFARAVARLFQMNYENYPTDHIMTKSTYLDDPEGNGIELYSESPEDGRFDYTDGNFGAIRADGSPSNGREAMDMQALFNYLQPAERLEAPIAAQVRLGHMHLHVRNVAEALTFYHDVLGFDIMGHAAPYQVAFVSAGGYHHHIGLNTWQGVGAPPPPADALGLRHFVIALPQAAALNEVVTRIQQAGIPIQQMEEGLMIYDPSHNGVLLISHENG